MTGLIGLHLHTCLMRRLGRDAGGTIPACYFVAVDASGVDPACGRAAYNCFGFWRDRANRALWLAAEEAVDNLARREPEYERSLRGRTSVSASNWAAVSIQGGGKSRRATEAFNEQLRKALDEMPEGAALAEGEIRKLVVDSLAAAFDTPSGVAAKVKDHLRGYGRAAGIVGPEGRRSRKRYQLEEHAIGLLARLHYHRDRVHSFDDEKDSVEVFLDDIFARYGMVITLDRERVRAGVYEESRRRALQSLLRHFPSEQAMSENRARLDRRLDELRLVRRYSDASALIHIP